MDELGFDVLWTAEHHFQREGYEVFPNLIQLGALVRHTDAKRLKFGCGFNILANVASDPPGQRLRDGRHRHRWTYRDGGWAADITLVEVETFGAPLLDAEKNRELFEEQLHCF